METGIITFVATMKHFLLIFCLLPVLSPAQEFQFKGLKRCYQIHVPVFYTSSKPVPLLIALHGGGGNSARMGKFSGFDKLSDRDTFLVVYPQAYEKHWNDGRDMDIYASQKDQVDDVGFISALIDTVQKKYTIDPSKVYVTGMSNGGMMSYRLACELGHRIKAIAAVIANIPVKLKDSCNPSQAIPVLIMNGTEDPLMPFEGGDVHLGKRKNLGKVISTAETVKFWLDKNRCTGKPLLQNLPDKDPADGCRVTETVYCTGVNQVVLYTIVGGGHNMPGCTPYLPKSIIGNTCGDINGAEVIWAFFKCH
jgi:polyhydroxybutyrate depolymerase